MANPGLTDEELLETLRIYEENDRNQSITARLTGLSRFAVANRISRARERGLEVREVSTDMPSFPDDDLDAEAIMDHMAARFLQRQKHADAKNWFAIRHPKDEPIAWNWFGDPHLGSNGCNVPLLRQDIEIVRNTPGMFAANIGDTVDNWSGRLLRLYADNDVSRQTERRLARWFLQEAGIPWRLWLHGNHDVMDGALVAYLEGINAMRIPMIDWRAKFRVCFPNGVEMRIDAAHNHKGHSQWNPLHGQGKAAVMDEPAELYIAGHHHEWALAQREVAGGRVINLARARGYKYLDEYAHRGQFTVQQGGASIVTVFNPLADNPIRRLQMFADVAEGADYLTWLRAK